MAKKTLAASGQDHKYSSELSRTMADFQSQAGHGHGNFEPTPAEPPKSLAPPPPRPAPETNGNTDYFTAPRGSLSSELNPFEQSFGEGAPETPGGTKLPPVAALTSPSSLLPGGGATPFNWGDGSLRTGPLSPAMLSGPTSEFFGDSHLRGGFPTPNESSLRTGLTPGGGGSMFPEPSPTSQALFAQMQNGGATPMTLDFHRSALAAAAAKREQQQQAQKQQQGRQGPQSSPTQSSQPQPAQSQLPPSTSLPPTTSQPQEPVAPTSAPAPLPASEVKTESKPHAGSFDPHDNDAANGLFMLAQGRNSAQPQGPYPVAPPPPQQQSVSPGTYASEPVSAVPPSATASASVSSVPISAPMPAAPVAPAVDPPRARQRLPDATGFSASISAQSAGTAPPASTNGSNSVYGARTSETGSPRSDKSMELSQATNGKGRGKRNSATESTPATNGRRKGEVSMKVSPPAKKVKTNESMSPVENDEYDSDDDEGRDGQPRQKMTEEEKRKNFLERNRVAALKCRQRKKQWLASLQSKVEIFTSENEALTTQITQLREEIVHLKTLLLAHKDCPITQQQGMHTGFVPPPMEPYNSNQIGMYNMAAPMQTQQAISTQVDQRRFS